MIELEHLLNSSPMMAVKDYVQMKLDPGNIDGYDLPDQPVSVSLFLSMSRSCADQHQH